MDASVGLVKADNPTTTARTDRGDANSSSPQTADPEAADAPDDAAPTRFDELIRSIRVRAGDKLTSARLQLQPPRLGYMEVDVRMEGDQVHIDVRTETDEARRQVHEQAVQLKSALEAAGIDVQQLRVSVDPEWLQHRDQSNHAWMHGRPQDQTDAGSRHSANSPHGISSGAGSRDSEKWDGMEGAGDAVASISWGLSRLDLRI